MIELQKKIELLAPAGTWNALIAAIDAGADAVYLGGKHFNMRVHKNDFNFDDEQLKQAIDYAHDHDVKLYITLNNLISDEELPALKNYLIYLNEIQPDAILVQDFSVIKLVNDLKIKIPMHASIMMNTHNLQAIEFLKSYGITRVVVSRELSLDQVKLLREQSGIETEYFIHGDMCISESGQCIHSGVIFGQSGNRGRCLKPCRWSYELIDESTGEILNEHSYKFALKDMCMYRNLPELINADVYSFKIEGRMRSPEFIFRIVSIYRRAIDRYLNDPTGYQINADDWKNLFDNRVRDYSTVFALNKTTINDIGLTGEREPKFFSKAIIEANVDDFYNAEFLSPQPSAFNPKLSVRVATIDAAKSALNNGADIVYIGGEVFDQNPLTIENYSEIINFAHSLNKKIVLNTPRTTYFREINELSFLLNKHLNFDGVMVSNLGSFNLAKQFSLPIQTDLSFNIFNHKAADFFKDNGAIMAATSLELSYSQVKSLIDNSSLPIEIVIHGSYESMICDHNFIKMFLNVNEFYKSFALKDTADQIHSLKIDQFGRNHIYFAKDLCLYNYLNLFRQAAALRMEAQLYSADFVSFLTKIYRQAIDDQPQQNYFEELQKNSPRPLGVGVYKFNQSKNSI